MHFSNKATICRFQHRTDRSFITIPAIVFNAGNWYVHYLAPVPSLISSSPYEVTQGGIPTGIERVSRRSLQKPCGVFYSDHVSNICCASVSPTNIIPSIDSASSLLKRLRTISTDCSRLLPRLSCPWEAAISSLVSNFPHRQSWYSHRIIVIFGRLFTHILKRSCRRFSVHRIRDGMQACHGSFRGYYPHQETSGKFNTP